MQIFSAILFVVAALLVILLLQANYTFEQLHSAGGTTQARVTDRETSSYKGGISYYLYLSFADAGQALESSASVNSEQYNIYGIGDLVTIRYLPADPSVVVVDWDASAPPTLQWLVAGCTTVWISVGLLGLFASFYPRRKLFWLMRGSEKLIGEITQAKGEEDYDGYYKVIVHYTFQSPTGETLNGKDSCRREDLRKNLPRKGTPIVILYRSKRTFVAL